MSASSSVTGDYSAAHGSEMNEECSNHTTTVSHTSQSQTIPLDLHLIVSRVYAAATPGYHHDTHGKAAHADDHNDPYLLAYFLEQRFGRNYMIFNLTGHIPSEPILQAFRNQIITLPWTSLKSLPSTETPSVRTLLPWVYAMQAWLSGHPLHVAVVTCANGWTRTALVMAAWLRAARMAATMQDGFCHFLAVRRPGSSVSPLDVVNALPPSVRTLFAAWDSAMEQEQYAQGQYQRPIPAKGVPEQPVMERRGRQGRSLHTSIQQEEETSVRQGFCPVNVTAQGDISISAQLHQSTCNDTSENWSFRYVSTIGATAPYELPNTKADVIRQYQPFVDPQTFLLTLVWELYMYCMRSERLPLLEQERSPTALVPFYTDQQACKSGWQWICQCLAQKQPAKELTESCSADSSTCLLHMIALASQLSHLEYQYARYLLLPGPFSSGRPPSFPSLDRKVAASLSSFDTVASSNTAAAHPEQSTNIPSSDNASSDALVVYQNHSMTAAREVLEFLKQFNMASKAPRIDQFMSVQTAKKEIFYGPSMNFPPQSPLVIPFPSYIMYHHHVGVSQNALDSRKSFPLLCDDPNSLQCNTRPPPQSPLISHQSSQDILLDDHALAVEALKKTDSVDTDLQRDSDMSTLSIAEAPLSSDPPLSAIPSVDNSNLAVELVTIINHPEEDSQDDIDNHTLQNAAVAPRLEELLVSQESSLNEHAPTVELVTNLDCLDRDVLDSEHDCDISSVLQAPLSPQHEQSPVGESTQEDPQTTTIPGYAGQETSEQDEARNKQQRESLLSSTLASAYASNRRDPPPSLADTINNLRSGDGDDTSIALCNNDLAMKVDPQFEKYWKMKSVGLPEGAIYNAMQRDGVDPSIWTLDWDRSYDSQRKTMVESNEEEKKDDDFKQEVPMKYDPMFEKYWKMKNMGIPEDAIRHAMRRDNVDVCILDWDWEKSYASQVPKPSNTSNNTDSTIAMKNDERFAKYWRMKGVGLPEGAIRNALIRDGLDPAIWDLDWDKSYALQTNATPSEDQKIIDVAIKDDPVYAKYWKMKSMGLPEGAIRNAMIRDGVDESVLELDWEKSLASQRKTDSLAESGPAIKDDPRFAKYWKMKSMGLPEGAIRNAMVRDGVDDSVLSLDWEKNFELQTKGNNTAEENNDPPIKDDERFSKYWKMKCMGLPEGAICNAMIRDGADETILALDWEKSLSSQRKPASNADTGVPLKDDEEYAKYFKMLEKGLPVGAVKNALVRDGKDPSIIDLDPNQSLAFQTKPIAKLTPASKKKQRVRRKKIYWNAIDHGQITEDSLWSLVHANVQLHDLKFDEQEFENLFTESTEPADQKRKSMRADSASKQKKLVQVIDGKRSMNGGIILLRLRLDYKLIAKLVETM
jgi:hypothetical protein